MTRIISGRAGGIRLETPPGASTRPTSDRVREALFSRLEHQGALDGAAVLDLYAGSGALGLEAASRGARSVVLVESDKRAAATARRNAAALAFPGVAVHPVSVERALATPPREPVDLVLADPPYGLVEDALAAVLHALVEQRWLAPDALVVVERSSRSPEPRWPEGLEREDERRYGETRIWFAGRAGPAAIA